MKKFFSFLAVALLALGGFTACEDIPAPYGIEDDIIGDGSKTLPFVQSFEASLGAYKSHLVSGEGRWINDHKAAVASGYNSADKKTTAGCYMLISPEISLAKKDSAHIVLIYTLRYLQRQDDQKIMITKSFDESKPGEGWTQIPATLEEVMSWEETRTADVNVPEEFLGEKVRIALYYNTNAQRGSSWQVKSLSVLEGVASGEEIQPEPQPEEGVKELPYSEAFASEMGGFRNYTTSGAGSWMVDNRGFAKASGFAGQDQPATQGTYYMVSPEISLAGKTEAHFSYEYINSFNDNPLNHQFVINPDFDESKPAEGWVALKADHEKTTSWTDWKKADIQIPAEYMGKNVRVAFRYECSTERASTFEVRNFSAAEGKAEGGEVTPQPEEGVQQLPYGEAFSSTFGLFKNYTTEGAGEWIIDYSTAKASGFDFASKTNTAGVYYLVSPEITLAGQTDAHVSFDYIYAYANKYADGDKLFITDKFAEDAPAESWTELPITLNEPNKTSEGKIDWKSFHKMDVQVPAEYMGKTVRIAFYHKCDENGSATWEIKNFSIAAGKAGEGGNEGGGDNTPDTGDVTASNGDFEAWVDGAPNNWQSASTASKGNLFQNEDAHGGKYSVQIGGNPDQNMRLAYKETEFKAGTYTMTFYTKAVTAQGGSVRPGFTPVEDGKVGNYVYGEYTNDLKTTEWTKVVHTVEIPSDGTYCLVIMNAKRPGADILIDDFTLVDASGKAIIK